MSGAVQTTERPVLLTAPRQCAAHCRECPPDALATRTVRRRRGARGSRASSPATARIWPAARPSGRPAIFSTPRCWRWGRIAGRCTSPTRSSTSSTSCAARAACTRRRGSGRSWRARTGCRTRSTRSVPPASSRWAASRRGRCWAGQGVGRTRSPGGAAGSHPGAGHAASVGAAARRARPARAGSKTGSPIAASRTARREAAEAPCDPSVVHLQAPVGSRRSPSHAAGAAWSPGVICMHRFNAFLPGADHVRQRRTRQTR